MGLFTNNDNIRTIYNGYARLPWVICLRPGGTMVLLDVIMKGDGLYQLLRPMVWLYFSIGGNDFKRAKVIRQRAEDLFGQVEYSTDIYGGYYYLLVARKPQSSQG